MKTMLLAGLACTLCLASFAERPPTITDEQFVEQVKTAVQTAKAQNPDVELLGWGTANLLDSHRESKILCGRGNPNPAPGECSDPYPIYPTPKPLAVVIANEQKAKVEADSIETAWVAWRDVRGINIAFNARVGDYELSTVTEVDDNGVWMASRKYYVGVLYAEKKLANGPEVKDAGFTWLIVGVTGNLGERFHALEQLGVCHDVKALNGDLLERYAEWRKINPKELSPEQQSLIEQFDQIKILPEDTLRFIGLWPWIDVANLTVRDKVFLMETGKDYEKYLAMALLG